ncbi:MAG: DegT/DnrJ/EryC1/StrS family aminotransferase [Pyrinomonadaceae bacterium]
MRSSFRHSPSFTFIAAAHALQWQNITPVFCGIDPATHCIDPERIEELITPRTSAILGVHLWGNPCDTDSLSEIAARHNLKLFFDAAHAFGCSHNGKMIGNFSAAEVFSFHATKFFNTMEGGAVVTNDDRLARKFRLMKDFGFTNFDEVSSIGINGKMNEVSAVVGLTNLESLDDFVRINQRNYAQYRKDLDGFTGIKLLAYDGNQKCNYQYVVVEIDESKCGLSRDDLLRILHAENILARRYFYPGCHRMEPYRSSFPDVVLPETEKVAERVLCLPTGTGVTAEQITIICKIIGFILQNGVKVSRRVSTHRALASPCV